MDALVSSSNLPHQDFAAAWDAIKLPAATRQRLVAQALLALNVRRHLKFEELPVHGLIVLAGPPGTGKTTLARGLANQIAVAVGGAKFVQVDPHALASSSLGKSQKEVTRLFHQVIPEAAGDKPCIVLLDEVETLAADRQRMSLEANPIDVHRATDAALAGIDLLTRNHPNVVLVATTNFIAAVDAALLSRADVVEQVGLPDADVRKQILGDVIDALARQWPNVKGLKSQLAAFAKASEGLDGRRLRKALLTAAATSIETAQNPGLLKAKDVVTTLRRLAADATPEDRR